MTSQTVVYTMEQLTNPTEAQLQEIYKLRVEAWQEAGIITRDQYPNGWSDEFDDSATHWVIRNHQSIIASSRACPVLKGKLPFELTTSNNKVFWLSRLVVHPEHRGQGLGTLLDGCRMKEFRKSEIEEAVIVARAWRLEKLKEFGFVDKGPIPGAVEQHKDGGENINLSNVIFSGKYRLFVKR